MCSLAASSCDARVDARSRARSLQRRGDVVGHRHRRVVDELLVDHRDVALAHRLAGDVLAVGEHAAARRRVEPGHHAHQRGLAGLRRAEQHGHRARHQRQVERVQVGLRADPLLDALERQLHARSVGAARGVGRGAPASARAHQSATARAAAGAQVQAELAAAPQHVVGAARPFVVVQVVQLGLVQAGRDLGAEAAAVEQRARRARRRRAPAARAAPAASSGWRSAQRLRRSARSRCRAAAACRSRRSGRRRAAARRGSRRRAGSRSGAASRSAASSASLRKVVILPPQTDQQRRAAGGVELEQVVARDRRRVAALVVEQRAHAGVAPDHVGRRRPAARSSGSPARTGRRSRPRRCAPAPIGAVVLDVGRADQREVALVRDREDDPLVGVLEDVGVVVVEQPRHDDVAALDQAQRLGARQRARARRGTAPPTARRR